MKSQFALSLVDLLYNTNLFDRRGWSEVLAVKESVIENWLNDVSIPRPDHLSMILLTLKYSSEIPDGPILEFERMSKLDSRVVSPLGSQMLPTVYDYTWQVSYSRI